MAPLVDPGTDCEDELSTPAGPPADVIHRMDNAFGRGVWGRGISPDDGDPCL